MAGILRERDIQAKNIDALNKSFKASFDVDGGNIISLAYGTDDVMTATAPVTGKLLGVAIAYNPSVRYTVVNNKKYAPLSVDERDYTNVAGVTGDCFIPQVGDEVGVIAANIEGVTAPTVGKFLEAANGKIKYTISPSQTANAFSMEVVKIVNEKFPKAGIGFETVPVYVCKVVAN